MNHFGNATNLYLITHHIGPDSVDLIHSKESRVIQSVPENNKKHTQVRRSYLTGSSQWS